MTRFTAMILTLALLFQSGSAGAATFDSLDASTAVAGSSASLRTFYESNQDANRKLRERLGGVKHNADDSDEDPDEDEQTLILFETPRIGIVSAPGFLNIRKDATTASEVVGQVLRGEELSAIGEVYIGDAHWYGVRRQDSEGYVSGDYLLFGEEAEALKALISEETKVNPMAIPASFELLDNISGLPAAVQNKILIAVRDLNYSLKNDYPPAAETDDYTRIYSILVYLLELYQQVADLAHENKLTATYNAANDGAQIIESKRKYLSTLTGQSEDDFFRNIVAGNQAAQQANEEAARLAEEARKAEEERLRKEEEARLAAEAAKRAKEEEERRRLEEEAARKAEEARLAEEERLRREEEARLAAEAAARAAELAQSELIAEARQEGAGTKGREMADYAATFVGILPYIWGGASLTTGADCSGFLGQILAHFGFLDQGKANWHGYVSGDFRSLGREVPLSEIRPGDIICYNGHVAMYFGKGIIVHEPNPNRFAEYGSMNVLPILTVRRFE